MRKSKYIYSWDEVPIVVDPAFVATMFGCTSDLICKLLRAGKIHGFKVGDLWRIRKDVLIEYTLKMQDNGNTKEESGE